MRNMQCVAASASAPALIVVAFVDCALEVVPQWRTQHTDITSKEHCVVQVRIGKITIAR